MTGGTVTDDSMIYEAEFKADGELIRPAGWRERVFIGTPFKPNSMNNVDGAFPEFTRFR